MQKLVKERPEHVSMDNFVYDKNKIYVLRKISPKADNAVEKDVSWGIFSEHVGEYGGYGFIKLGDCSNGWTQKPEWNASVEEYFRKMLANEGCVICDILIFKDIQDFIGWMSYECCRSIFYLKYCDR